MNKFKWDRSFGVDFDLGTGLSQSAVSTKRYLSQMKGMYNDIRAYDEKLDEQDELVYEFYELGSPEDQPGDLAFGTSITYPGAVGNEYYMTKGHFHTKLDTAEVYYLLSGEGYLLMESPEGGVCFEKMEKGKAIYVPRRYAHRSINTGDVPLVSFYVYRADAGHDYGTIESKGFRKLVIKSENGPVLVDNPNWRD